MEGVVSVKKHHFLAGKMAKRLLGLCVLALCLVALKEIGEFG